MIYTHPTSLGAFGGLVLLPVPLYPSMFHLKFSVVILSSVKTPGQHRLWCQRETTQPFLHRTTISYYLSPQLILCDRTCCLRAKPSFAIAIRLQKYRERCCNLQPILIKTLSLAVTLKLASYFKDPECTGTVFSTSL